MKKLTPQELAEPNVEYYVPDNTTLPRAIRQEPRYFIGAPVHNERTGQTGTRYNIPAYLAREWLAKYAHVLSPQFRADSQSVAEFEKVCGIM